MAMTIEQRREAARRAKAKYRASEKGRATESAYGRSYREKNRDVLLPQMRAYAAVYRRENPEKIKTDQRVYRERPGNRERARKQTAEWRRLNPGRTNDAMRRRYAANREYLLEKSLKWQRDNPDKVAIRAHNYRARKMAAGGRLSAGLVSLLLTEQDGKCCYCFVVFEGVGFHLDHYTPLILGGTNDDENIVLACPSCDCSKRHSHPLDFLRRVGLWA
jgi:5-methylcytosine-specific restriction endonuclease McrA